MMLSRRFALFGLLAAPAIIKTAGLLMPVRPVLMAQPIMIESWALTWMEQVLRVVTRNHGDFTYSIPSDPNCWDRLPDGGSIEIGKLPAGVEVTGVIMPVSFDGAATTLSIGRA